MFHKQDPFVCRWRKPTAFRWWEEPYKLLQEHNFPYYNTRIEKIVVNIKL